MVVFDRKVGTWCSILCNNCRFTSEQAKLPRVAPSSDYGDISWTLYRLSVDALVYGQDITRETGTLTSRSADQCSTTRCQDRMRLLRFCVWLTLESVLAILFSHPRSTQDEEANSTCRSRLRKQRKARLKESRQLSCITRSMFMSMRIDSWSRSSIV